jgi:Domain of unknown function (DUF4214)
MIFHWNSTGGIPDFIKTLYQNILDRDPENQGVIDGWTNHALFHGIAATIGGFFTSDEFKAKNLPQEIVVDKLYRSILGCEGDPEGKNFWLSRFRCGDAIQIVITEFVGSPDYRQKAQNNIVPQPAFAYLLTFLSTQYLTSGPLSELYLHGPPLAEYLISLKRCIKTSSVAILRIRQSSMVGPIMPNLTASPRP